MLNVVQTIKEEPQELKIIDEVAGDHFRVRRLQIPGFVNVGIQSLEMGCSLEMALNKESLKAVTERLQLLLSKME